MHTLSVSKYAVSSSVSQEVKKKGSTGQHLRLSTQVKRRVRQSKAADLLRHSHSPIDNLACVLSIQL